MSNNLELSQVAPSQNNKETTINDQAGQLDAGLTDKVDVALTGTTSPLVLSDAQALRCMVLKLTGTHPGGAYEVHCPTNRKIYVVWNSTAGDVIFKTVAGTGIAVTAGAVLILYCDANGAWYPVEYGKVLPSSPDGGYHACWGNAAGRPNFRCIILPGVASLAPSEGSARITSNFLFSSREKPAAPL